MWNLTRSAGVGALVAKVAVSVVLFGVLGLVLGWWQWPSAVNQVATYVASPSISVVSGAQVGEACESPLDVSIAADGSALICSDRARDGSVLPSRVWRETVEDFNTADTSETATTSSTAVDLDVPVESAYGAFCSGMIAGTDSFKEGMEGVEYWELFGDYTWFECMDMPRDFVYDEAVKRGVNFDDLAFAEAYVWGCMIPATQWDIETFGPYLDDSFPDTETRTLYNEAACAIPFRIAFDEDVDWEILRSGVCRYRDSPLSDAQIEAGMLRCP